MRQDYCRKKYKAVAVPRPRRGPGPATTTISSIGQGDIILDVPRPKSPELKASDHIHALVCGYASQDRAEKHLVMLQAFADDSASESGERRLFLCAYVNTAEKWADFSDAWQETLDASPSAKYFKMAEAQNLRGQFDGWSGDERDAKVLSLAKVIKRYRPWSVGCSVSRNDYDRILAPVSPHNLKNPYFSCFYGLIYTLARYHHSARLNVPVDFIFDEQGGLGLETVMFYQWLKQDLQHHEWTRLLGGPPIFRDDKLVRPLQAADMLAWHIRREHEGIEPPGSRPAMKFLIADGLHVIADLDASVLKSLAGKMRRVPGVEKVSKRSQWRATKKDILKLIASSSGPPSMPVRATGWSVLGWVQQAQQTRWLSPLWRALHHFVQSLVRFFR